MPKISQSAPLLIKWFIVIQGFCSRLPWPEHFIWMEAVLMNTATTSGPAWDKQRWERQERLLFTGFFRYFTDVGWTKPFKDHKPKTVPLGAWLIVVRTANLGTIAIKKNFFKLPNFSLWRSSRSYCLRSCCCFTRGFNTWEEDVCYMLHCKRREFHL